MMTKSLFLFIIVFTFNIVYGELIIRESDLFEINDEFNYCEDIGNPVIVDFQSLCKHKSIIDTEKLQELSILSKNKHVVSGEGYECKKEVIILTTHEDFFGQHTYNINKNIVKLSREDCDNMVFTRRCD